MSIVLKLQKKCLDRNEDLQSLLREALLISTKLKLKDFKSWINNELKGYDNQEVSKYRVLHSTLKFFDPYQGLIPAIFNNEKLANILTTDNIIQSIGELEHLCKSEENELTLKIPPMQEKKLWNILGQIVSLKNL